VCCVFFECNLLFCVMCVFRVLCLIVVQLPPGIIPFAVKTSNDVIFLNLPNPSGRTRPWGLLIL
jgi:hypothetical protein